jgi:hypothetical protein
MTGPLAKAVDDSSLGPTLLAFLRDYGVLLCSGAAPAEPVVIAEVGGRPTFQTHSESGTYVVLSQSVDGFAVKDTLIGGRFVGYSLMQVTGRVFDPAASPSRQSLACGHLADAKQLFDTQSADLPQGVFPSPYVSYRTGRAYWRTGSRRLDARTCEWMPDVQGPIEDPASGVQKEVAP